MDINEEKELLRDITAKEYKEGFVTDVEQEFIPKGLNEDIVRMISERKGEPQWLLDFRLDAFRKWQPFGYRGRSYPEDLPVRSA